MTNAVANDLLERECIRFEVALPPSGLRRNRLARDHGYRARLVREYAEQVWCAARSSPAPDWGVAYMNKPEAERVFGEPILPWLRARVHYAWHSTHQTDEDNIIASMKAALDVLGTRGARPLGIIVDDKDAEVTAEWVKCGKRADERVEISVERIV